MTAVYWILGIVAYLAIAVGVMRWRTARINAGKAWSLLVAVSEDITEKTKANAHQYTVAVGLLWPFTVVYGNLMVVIVVGFCYLWQGIDWTMRKLAGLPRK